MVLLLPRNENIFIYHISAISELFPTIHFRQNIITTYFTVVDGRKATLEEGFLRKYRIELRFRQLDKSRVGGIVISRVSISIII